MQIKISLAKVEDLDRVLELDCKYFSNIYSREYYLENIYNESVLVAHYDNFVVGYIIFSTIFDESEILKIVVDQDFRNKKIGSCLMEKFIKTCDFKDVVKIVLEVRESNISAIKLYEKFEFKKVRVIKDYYSEPLENGLMMIRGNYEES